jgi:uncharacterized protein
MQSDFLLLTLWALCFGSLVGLSGIGLGSVGTAGLVLLFRVDPVIAVGTNTVNGFLIKALGSYRHFRYKHVEGQLARELLIGALPGEILGVGLAHLLPAESFKKILGVALILVGLLVLRESAYRFIGPSKEMHPARATFARGIAVGLVVGVLVGLTSSGSGTILVTVFMLLYRRPPRIAVGTALFTANLLLLFGAILHIALGHLNITLLLPLFAGSSIGIVGGSFFCRSIPQEMLKIFLGLVITGSGVTLSLM